MRNKDVIEAYDRGDKLDFIFFWGHTNKSNSVNKTCFSQWYTDSGVFVDRDFEYDSCEHYMMLHKLFTMNSDNINDPLVDEILECPTTKGVKAIGRKIPDFDSNKWDDVKFDIVVEGNFLKFSQDDELKDFLLSTGDKILVEASPFDKIWGIGLDSHAPNVDNPNTWKGDNLLGYALMEVRDRLKD